MKILIYILLVCFAASALMSCKKNAVEKPTIFGLWHIVSDTGSTLNIANTLVNGNGPYSIKIIPGDYYNFASNGKLYVNEQSIDLHDTVEYTVLNDTTLNIYYFQNNVQVPFDGNGPVNIATLTAHTLVLDWFVGAWGTNDERIVFER